MSKHPKRAAAIALVVMIWAAVAPAGTGKEEDLRQAAMKGESPRVAVADFDDQSGARLANVGAGVADKLADRLAAGGTRVVGRGEIEALLQSQGLDPLSFDDLSYAARQLGAAFVITGTVESLAVNTSSLGLGPLHLAQASAHAEATACLLDAAAEAVAAEASGTGDGKGTTSLSLDLGSLLAPSSSNDLCAGGLRAERGAYSGGDLVSFGYANSRTSKWFGLEIYSQDGTFLRWLGWRFIPRGTCRTWFWDQRDALGAQVSPGIYVARLRDGSDADAAAFQIRPGLTLALPALDLFTVGTRAFDGDVAGAAIDEMVTELAESLLPAILSVSTLPEVSARTSGAATEGGAARTLLGQVAAVLPDRRVAISVGASHGVVEGDRFLVLAVDELVFDPDTLSVTSYNVLATKGEIHIVEARELASYGVCEGEFEPLVGDLVRLLP